MMMILLIGIPASCKSSFYLARLSISHVHVNLDTLKTRQREQSLINDCIDAKQSYAIDNTNCSVKVRENYIKQAKESGYCVHGYFFNANIHDALKRNRHREGNAKTPDVAIYAIAKKLEFPSLDEGFDLLFTVRIDGCGGFVVTKVIETF